MKWWGWGNENVIGHIEKRPGILPYLQTKFSLDKLNPSTPFQLEKIQLNDSLIPSEIFLEFVNILGIDKCKTDKLERVLHSFGKSYKDLIRIRSGKIENPPDIVVYPKTEEDVHAIFKLCEKHQIALIPFGGGTSVVSGVECFKGKFKYCCTLNMTNFNKFLGIDLKSYTAEIEAGMFGPELEGHLSRHGFTFGHFPQSFEFSTIGGWIAARSSGQNSLKYGGIEKLVQSIKMLTPNGMIQTLNVPRMATGVDFNEIVLGSEGRLGIILSAVVKITPIPEEKKYFMYLFPSFSQASLASRILVQQGIKPAMVRVSDEAETEGMMAMGKEHLPWWKSLLKSIIKKYLTLRGFDLSEVSNVMVGFEGDIATNKILHQKLKSVFTAHGGFCVGDSPGKKWLKDRFFLPYFRDEFLDNNLLVDTLETATTWAKLDEIYKAVVSTIEKELKTSTHNVVIYTHISHLYTNGASLYFSIIANQNQKHPMEQWEKMKNAVNNVLKFHQAPISHHHGMGMDHINGHHWGKTEKSVFNTVSKQLDPAGILNPGKLCNED